MSKHTHDVYVEPCADRFAVLKPNAQRASAVRDIQAEAFAAAKKMFPS